MAILIPQPAAIRKADLDSLGPVKVPLSFPAATLVGKKFIDDIPGIDSMGIWECSPGRWQRTIMEEEFAHFISGSARFVPTDGEPIDIRAGDSIWFPANSAGIWEISEDVRKVYVIITRPTLLKRLRFWLKNSLQRWLSPSDQQVTDSNPAAQPSPEPLAVWRQAQGPLQNR